MILCIKFVNAVYKYIYVCVCVYKSFLCRVYPGGKGRSGYYMNPTMNVIRHSKAIMTLILIIGPPGMLLLLLLL